MALFSFLFRLSATCTFSLEEHNDTADKFITSVALFVVLFRLRSTISYEKRQQLENVFMKHYAPNYMPDPKGEWTLKENNSELHHGICSKVNQFIYTLVCNYMPNIRILAKAVLHLFRSQGCSYTKCLCRANGSNSTENLRNVLKS